MQPYSLTTLQPYSITTATALEPYSLTSLQPHTALQPYSITALQPYNPTALQHYNLTALQPYSLTTLQHCNPTALQWGLHSIALKTQTIVRMTFPLFDKGYLITSFSRQFFSLGLYFSSKKVPLTKRLFMDVLNL